MKSNINRIQLGVIIAMCGIVGASIGINISATGVFYTPMAKALNVGKGAVSLGSTILSTVMAITCLSVTRLMKKIRVRTLLWISALLLIGGTVMCAVSENLWQLYLWNAVKGLGAGLSGFVVATVVINNWVYVKRGLIMSIVMSFSGVGGLLFATPFSMIIESYGYQAAYVAMAVFIFVFYIPALFFPLAEKPEQIGQKPYGYEEYLTYRKNQQKQEPEKGVSTGEVKGEKFALMILFTSLVCIIAAMVMHLSGYAEVIGLGSSVGALMISAVNLANVFAKIMYGTLSDKAGTLKASLFVGGLSLFGLAGFLFLKSPVGLLLSSILYGFTMPNSAVALSLATSDLFGSENYTKIYPVVNFAGSLTNSFGMTIYGVMYDITESYRFLFMVTLIMQVIALELITFLYKRKETAELV